MSTAGTVDVARSSRQAAVKVEPRVGRPVDVVPAIVAKLYESVRELESLFPGRRFTLDGHLVGSIGEVLAAHWYGLDLLSASLECHDATNPDGCRVQVKATQVDKVGLSSEPDHLIVLKLHEDGEATEVYNGPGCLAWEGAGTMQKNGQRFISLYRLRALMAEVPVASRLPRRSPDGDLGLFE